MKRTFRILSIIGAAALFVVLFFTSFQLGVFNMNYIDREMSKYNITEVVDMTDEDLHDLFSETLDYLSDDREDLVIDTVVSGQEREAYNEREKLHMVDVKSLFTGGFTIRNTAFILLLACTAALILLKVKGREKIRVLSVLSSSLVFTWAAILVLFVVAVVLLSQDFDKYFILFHQVFFNNDYWILDPNESLMINMLPEGFFYDTAMRILAIFAVPFLALFGLSSGYLIAGRLRKRKQG